MSTDIDTPNTSLPATGGPTSTTTSSSLTAGLGSNLPISSIDPETMSRPASDDLAHAPEQQQQQPQQEEVQQQQQQHQDPAPADLQQQQTGATNATNATGATGATSTSNNDDARPDYIKSNPSLQQFFESLPSILTQADHHEMWGVELTTWDDYPTVNVLIKFLRANDGNVKLAQEQLGKALAWRKKMNPQALVDGVHSSKFAGLGYLTKYSSKSSGKEEIFTWNVYGSAAKNVKETFGNVDEFIKWRVALMERAVAELKLNTATTIIPMTGEDPYQMIQVHDYLNVSFLRMDPTIKSATKSIIEVFSTAYPELLREKYFVNVPIVMSWVFSALKVFLAKNTVRKFHPITNGANLAREFDFRDDLPKEYGGKAPSLKEAADGPQLEGQPARESKTNLAPTSTTTSAPAPQPEPTPEADAAGAAVPASTSETRIEAQEAGQKQAQAESSAAGAAPAEPTAEEEIAQSKADDAEDAKEETEEEKAAAKAADIRG
ncbi:hypothetical protein KEM56_004731 [Ascosphaera pollenicola]|nr:hypothetical protein KEM56_004731 [Ascosphaera pollenicola]